MKKILLFIVGLLFVGTSFAYDVIIYDENNNVLMMYPVEEGTTEITLDGDWFKNGDNYTFNGGYNGTDVYYIDGYGKSQSVKLVSDIYLNGQYSIGYTGDQYTYLYDSSCGIYEGFKPVFQVTGTTSVNTGNIFTNFSDNMFTLLLSNIPGYIQYITIFAVILLLISLIRRLGRRK